ncbi:MAG: MoaD/ThiS family protein [Candidatus Methylomirabilales bacterium]
MSVLVRIPTPLRTLTQGQAEVQGEGGCVQDLIENLETRYKGLKERLCDGRDIRRFINIYVNDEDIRFLQGTATPLKPGDHVSIVPAIAGGA